MSALGIWPTFLDKATETPACRGEDTNLFFPTVGEHGEEAKAICDRCPLKQTCRDWALNQPLNQVWGIWGGMNDIDRRRWKHAKNADARKAADECELCGAYVGKFRYIHHARHHMPRQVAA